MGVRRRHGGGRRPAAAVSEQQGVVGSEQIGLAIGVTVEPGVDLGQQGGPVALPDGIGDRIWARLKQRSPDGWLTEFDAVATTPDLVVLNSTTATLRSADVDAFVGEIDVFRALFPEYAERPLIDVLASLSVDDNVLAYAEKRGFLVLAVGDEVMEVKTRPGFEPKRW